MSLEVHVDWKGQTHLVGLLHAAERGSSVSFEYALKWLQRTDAFAIDPTSLPLQRGAHHGRTLFGAIHDCGPDRWGRILIERAVRKKVLAQKPYPFHLRVEFAGPAPRRSWCLHFAGRRHPPIRQ